MLKKTFQTFTLVFLALLLGACDSGPKIDRIDQTAVILAFGDSLTHGTGAAPDQSYPKVLSQKLGRAVINAGVPGETTAQGLKRLPDLLETYAPTLVILCEGGNDFLRRQDPEQTARNLSAMVDLIKARGADVILVGVPKLGFGLSVPPFYAALAEKHAIPFEGEILLELLGDKTMKSDSIHPNAAGYHQMAAAIYEKIMQAQRK
ncbi:MAG: arylesterase [Desulfuromonadales bacterium]|jgi:acyl-CoA thioesterase I